MIRCLLQVGHIRWHGREHLVGDALLRVSSSSSVLGFSGHYVRMQGDSPSLEARVLVRVSFKDLKGDALFAECLGEGKATKACTNDENVHYGDDCDKKTVSSAI